MIQRARTRDARLIVVSNRLPVTIRHTGEGAQRVRSTGGLVAAFEPTLERRGGLWVGWPGTELRSGDVLSQPGDPYRLEAVRITPQELRDYYHGFANRALWPLFHTMPTRTSFRTREWHTYQRVNERFAAVTAEALGPGDLVWVNDYHLMLTPALLRSRVPRARIGFFLHIPFPPYDAVRVLPWARELLRGLLAADVIGFHVPGYVQNFLDAVRRLLGVRVDRRGGIVPFEGRHARVGPFPLGVDFGHFAALARRAPDNGVAGPERIILGVDRLDYTKGIPQRLLAFERLLERHAEHRQKITLLQLAVPSRAEVQEYRWLKREIDELVGRVNGRFGTAAWTPIRYLYRSLPQDRLAGMYRDADVALVTPLRDGMNLVAKEFVACQVRDPGVLVLSYLAGAAETMQEAVLVNPYDIDDTAHKLHQALTMRLEERRQRMDALRRRERASNVHAWARKFLRRLAATGGDGRRRDGG